MTTKLQLYNNALLICGERQLSATTGLTEATEPRYLLDSVWNNGGVDLCLSSGQWTFAMRTIEHDYDASITPGFGYTRGFLKPSDFIALSALCTDEYFSNPLLHFVDEAGYWYADYDTIYVRYVSNATTYGGDLSLWPAKFTEYASAHFAAKIVMKITSDEKKQELVMKYAAKVLMEAKNLDAMGNPTKFPPSGSWSSARIGTKRGDRGNNGSLLG